MRLFSWGDNPDKWVIRRISPGCWAILPPVPSFWGRTSSHATFEEAVEDFVLQTQRDRRGWKTAMDINWEGRYEDG